jgi:hypothetical protein
VLPEDDPYTPPVKITRKIKTRSVKPVQSETAITAGCLLWLNAQPRTYAWKLHTGPLGKGGHPDIDGCTDGRSIKIEMKRPGEKPDPRQRGRLESWRAAGALVGWATSLEEVQQIYAHRHDPKWFNPLTRPGAEPLRKTL